MRIEKNTHERYTLLCLLDDKINSLNAPDVKSEFVLLSSSGVRNIIVNLKNVNYIDSSGLSAILIGNRLCNDKGGVLVLCHLTEHVEKLITISKLNDTLNIIPTESEAIDEVIFADVEADLLAEGDATTLTNA